MLILFCYGYSSIQDYYTILYGSWMLAIALHFNNPHNRGRPSGLHIYPIGRPIATSR